MKSILAVFLLLAKTVSAQTSEQIILDAFGRIKEHVYTGYKVVNTYDRNNNLVSYEIVNTCVGFNILNFNTNTVAGATYHWEINSGSGYSQMFDNAVYKGTQTNSLRLTNSPTSFSGFTVRCAITSGGTISYSPAQIIRYNLIWTGNVNSDWQNASNWSCGNVPDGFTDVTVPAGLLNYPSVIVNTDVRKLVIETGARINIASGIILNIKGL